MTTTEQILIFDGDCGFCTACARWIEHRWTRTPTPRIIPWQALANDWPDLATPTIPQMRESVWWIDGNHRRAGSRAIANALVATSSPWRLVGFALLSAPLSWFGEPAYRVVARHRHRLPGSTSACRVLDER
jgi:predicted DCC family thiol-disulfide oxidoreductase YuxK